MDLVVDGWPEPRFIQGDHASLEVEVRLKFPWLQDRPRLPDKAIGSE